MAKRKRKSRSTNVEGRRLSKTEFARVDEALDDVIRRLHPEISVGLSEFEQAILASKPRVPPRMPQGLGKVMEGFAMLRAGIQEMKKKAR